MKKKSSKQAIVFNEEDFTEDNDPSFRDGLGENLLKKGNHKLFIVLGANYDDDQSLDQSITEDITKQNVKVRRMTLETQIQEQTLSVAESNRNSVDSD